MFILQHKRLQRIRQRRRLFRRVSSLYEQQRKKVLADVLLSDLCPLYVYEGFIVDGATVERHEPVHIAGTSNQSVQSPSLIWQNRELVASKDGDSNSVLRKSKFSESAIEAGESEVPMQHNHVVSSGGNSSFPSRSSCGNSEDDEQVECVGADECCICLDNMRVGEYMRKLPCGHFFHATCVERWLLHAHRCPLCNKDLVSCFNRSVPIEDENWLNTVAQNERQRRPGWNRPFSHIRYLFQEYPFEWRRLQLLLESNSNISDENV